MLKRELVKGKVLIVVFVMWNILYIAPGLFAQAYIVLTLGEQKLLEVEGLERVAVGDPNIADVKLLADGKQVLITAKGIGETNLILWREGQEETRGIRVTSTNPKQIAKEVKQILGDIEGLRVKVVGERVILNGKVLTLEDLKRIQKVSEMFPQVFNFVERSYVLIDTIAEQINTALIRGGITKIKARKVGNKVFMEGDAANDKEKENITQIASALVDDPGHDIVNLVRVGVSETIVIIDALFEEVNELISRRIGFNWGDSAGIDGNFGVVGNIGEGNPNFLGPITLSSNYSLILNVAHQDGNARTLANPKLLCASGGEANFLAGGEIPIPLITADTATVEYKEYGLRLKFNPFVTNDEDITLSIEVEISQVDPSVTVMGTPGFLTRRV
ncbi:MAG: pilus assembly protein N-terminal domain-containing protein, partial [Thermodesulfobacteriota bacterium]|nr:pilus assembly protein N-terminal domain-containing protein [Thermodesulfobacteriota bacterium]